MAARDIPEEAKSPHPQPLPAASAEKHSLQNAWTIWFTPSKKPGVPAPANYEDCLNAITTVKTVEDFWSYFVHLKRPTSLGQGADYLFFKNGVKPIWEDAANKAGGKFIIAIPETNSIADPIWEKLLLGLIGEYIDVGDEITGAVFSRRSKENRIAIWTRRSSNVDILTVIADNLRKNLELGTVSFQFTSHEAFAARNYSAAINFTAQGVVGPRSSSPVQARPASSASSSAGPSPVVSPANASAPPKAH